MKISYKPRGTCSVLIDVEINDNDTINDVNFVGGCGGNLKGISTLLKGMTASDAIQKLRGIRCGSKSTSCPDQLSLAIEEAIRMKNAEKESDSTEKESE